LIGSVLKHKLVCLRLGKGLVPDRCIDFLDQLPLCRTRPRPLSRLDKTVNTKLGLSVRFDQDVGAALEKAAKDDRRPVSHLVQKIVADWLKKKDFFTQ
jgi:hypothetical protein